MARKNPLAPGRYWVDVPLGKAVSLDFWLESNKDSVTIESRETLPTSNISSSVVHYILNVTRSLTWPTDRGWAWPTAAGTGVQTHEDTVQRPPPPPSVTEQPSSAVGDVKTLAAVAVLAYLWLNAPKKGRR